MERPELFPKYGNESVELCLEGVFNPKEFADSVVAFVGVITGVSESVDPNAGTSDWAITVKEGSMLIQAVANPGIEGAKQTVRKVAPMICQGLMQLESDVDQGNHSDCIFGEKVLKHIRKIADLTNHGQEKTVSIKSAGKKVLFTPQIAQNTNHLLSPKKAHSAIGHVEGKLSTLAERRGFKMVVYRSLDGLAVECITDDPDLEAHALKAFRKRVSIQGIVKYNNQGKPVSVIAKQIRILRSESDLIPIPEIKANLNEQA